METTKTKTLFLFIDEDDENNITHYIINKEDAEKIRIRAEELKDEYYEKTNPNSENYDESIYGQGMYCYVLDTLEEEFDMTFCSYDNVRVYY